MVPRLIFPNIHLITKRGRNRAKAVSCASSTSGKIVGVDTFLSILQRQHQTCHFFLGPNACLLALSGTILHYWILLFFVPTHDSFRGFRRAKVSQGKIRFRPIIFQEWQIGIF
ncbi:hypothetical protein CDAR_192521 [Caerostris darwini]|uniref:Uncharacterized protein n=1 Tax=Caerostris darwini TaxID=1538125 RepID=A0AAV4W8A1_9ARAC|nr:hypothetical protein CDAR_192521 [Caerostris darwini]